MSAVETLREAAQLMRVRAEEADYWTPERWSAVRDGAHGFVRADRDGLSNFAWRVDNLDTARHIAALDPTVALAIADWLDATAREFDSLGIEYFDGHPLDGRRTAGLAVARTYLRIEAP